MRERRRTMGGEGEGEREGGHWGERVREIACKGDASSNIKGWMNTHNRDRGDNN